MATIDKLRELAEKSIPTASESEVTLELRPDDTAEVIVKGLKDYFGRDDQRKSIRIVFDDGEIGWLQRKSLYKLASLSSKGLGDSDGMDIPTPSPTHVELIRLCCPQVGCDSVRLVTRFKEDNPPRCKIHKSISMERCP